MSTKKVSYMSLLKEAISEFDTSKNVDVKGPFLDPILGYDGGGELPTHKDAASILERYYFNEENDQGVKVEHKDDAMPEVPPKDDNAAGSLKKDIETAVADDETPSRDAAQDTKLGEDADVEVDGEDLNEADDIENAVIEKLISEMEDLDEDLTEEVKIGDDNPTEPAGMPDEDLEKTLPDRKDDHEASVKANKVTEAEEAGEAEESDDDDDDDDDKGEEEGGEEKELDVDAEVKKEGLGPDLRSSAHDNPDGTAEELEEAFAIFKEAIEEDDDDGVEKKD